MGEEVRRKPRRNWIQEERRATLGDWVAFCLSCGHSVRYFEQFEQDVPDTCPQCTGPMRRSCPACNARFPSVFQVECEECGAEIRSSQLFGTRIRKPGK